MHDFAELIFHAIVGLLRALWAVCEFVFQMVAETGGEWLVGLFPEKRKSPPVTAEQTGLEKGYKSRRTRKRGVLKEQSR